MAVVLFGSRARGEAGESSDWDLLVLARDLSERAFERHLSLKAMLPPLWRGQVTLLAKTPSEFEAYLPDVYLDIALDGVILYDPEGYAALRLARLNRLIQSHGLVREKFNGDLRWKWERFPGFGWSLRWESAV